MKKYLLKLDRQIQEAFELGRSFSLPRHFDKVKRIVFSGIGGSAMSGDILRALSDGRSRLSFHVNRSADLPSWACRPGTLFIFSSYSGNTHELLHVFKQAARLKLPLLAVSSGGELARLVRRKKMPYLPIPTGLPPRCAIGYLTFSVLAILAQTGFFKVSSREIGEVVSVVRGVSRSQARQIARRLKGKNIFLYAASGLMEPAVVRWRAQLAENAKTLASHHVLPEMFHNEIEGWQFPRAAMKRAAAVFLIDRGDPAWVRNKREHAEKRILQRGAAVLNIRSRGRTPLARLFSLIALGDWVSYELALLNGVDPLPTPELQALKQIA